MQNKCEMCNEIGSIGYPNKWRESVKQFICSRCYGKQIKKEREVK